MDSILSLCGCRRRSKLDLSRVAPADALRLSLEELEGLCARSGFTRAEILRLHGRFRALSNGKAKVEAKAFLQGIPELDGPLAERLPSVLRLEPTQTIDFGAAVAALTVFCERTPVDDKMRLFFRLYDADGDGRLSVEDLRSTLRLILPADVDDEIVDHAVSRTLEELGGRGATELTQEQFAMVATDLARERGTVFF
eukprot:TRINITY_DN25630_c0_g1_i2.p1 TRINITY_DN25630_c0_g1~~TRINITY_DN25630_c0_g1_i2.p1  ORF type:complete len:211 (+),score=47.87 TRINITY_DN25630_c0_g1_i2:45-635(+)